ncbi:MAG: MBL fold metallo-hydrolase [Acidaminococcus sp.]|uniref:MBL fold metallo-hydrolase n=1 Tax=Acidaminococcus sp. TaxID=1872103 RepID=UPI003F18BDCF
MGCKKDGTNGWQIRSDGDYCYLLAGDDLAVMIDDGYGSGNIRAFAQTLTDKSVKYVINTHYHFDHTANDAYFDAAFMTAESVPYATIPYASCSPGITRW